MKILLVIPPFTQLNTPYPSVPFLANYLRRAGHQVTQIDLGIFTVRKLFSSIFLDKMKPAVLRELDSGRLFLDQFDRWNSVIKYALDYIDGIYPEFELQVLRGILPETVREQNASELLELNHTPSEQARFRATLMFEELADIIRDSIDPNFSLVRYDSALAPSLSMFSAVEESVKRRTLLSEIYLDEIVRIVSIDDYDIAGFSLPFPGTLVAALQCMERIHRESPSTKICAGGGYVSTELREISSADFFSYCDFLFYDSGEIPIAGLISYMENRISKNELIRCAALDEGKVCFYNQNSTDKDFTHYAPDYSGLDLSLYIQFCDTPNRALRLWSEGRWNKLAVAYGCYWAKCAFCDGTLDYIGSYVPFDPILTVDRMDALAQGGIFSFHFVDEAAPPALLMKIAIELLRRGRRYTWWTNIRFEKSFTKGMCRLLALSGLIAVSGGIEIADDSGLTEICKGITLSEIAKVTGNFSQNGILVHAYLIHGFPGESVEQTANSLEAVRQLFAEGCLASGYWHTFALTVHSSFYKNLSRAGSSPRNETSFDFARNDVQDNSLHAPCAKKLRRALYNFMHESMLDKPVTYWLGKEYCSTLHKSAIREMIRTAEHCRFAVWIGGEPQFTNDKIFSRGLCTISLPDMLLRVEMERQHFEIIFEMFTLHFSGLRVMKITEYENIKSARSESFLVNFFEFIEMSAILKI